MPSKAKKKPSKKVGDKPSFAPSNRKIFNVPLNAVQANPGNPGDYREREVIPELFDQGYRIFPEKGIADDHCLWTMLNGVFGKDTKAAWREHAVTLIREFEESVVEMADSIENTALVHPVHFVVQGGCVGIESGMVRAFAKSYKDAVEKRPPGTIEGEVEFDPDEKMMLARATVENIHVIVNQPIALAQRFALMRSLEMSIEDIAKKVRRSEQTIRNYLDIAEHPSDVQNAIASGSMTMQAALDMNRRSRDENKPLDDVVQDWRDEQSAEHELGVPSGTGSVRSRTKGHKMLKWDRAFLVFASVFEKKPDREDLSKLTKEQLIDQIARVHAAAITSLCQVLQINEDEAIQLTLEHQAVEFTADDFGFE